MGNTIRTLCTLPSVDVCTAHLQRWRWAVVLFGLCACVDGGSGGAITADSGRVYSEGRSLSPTFVLTWEDDALSIAIEDGEGGSFWFGAADLTTNERWTGEDCYRGDVIENTSVLYCHPIGETGARLLLGGDPLNLAAGTQTALEPAHSKAMRYYFVEVQSGACWLGGTEAQYYDGLCENEDAVIVE